MEFIFRWIFLLGLIPSLLADPVVLSLNGDNWEATNANGSIVIPATVPGGIYTDLLRAGVIEDPYYRFNDMETRWVAYDNWTFSRDFTVDSALLSKQQVLLTAYGLDTVSTILINGNSVGSSVNQFVRYSFDVKSFLSEGTNTISVEFRSPVNYAYAKSDQHDQEQGYSVPPECTAGVQNGECHVNFIRKAQSQFSWDWGPAFPSSGIWKDIQLEGIDAFYVRDIAVSTTPTDDEERPWTVEIRVFADTVAEETPASFSINLNGQQLLAPTDISFASGLTFSTLVSKDFNIQTWWPNGYGDQNLYDLEVILTTADGSETVSKTIRVGFRTVLLVGEPVSDGDTFYFRVNGIPIFLKGSNWIPADVLPERVTPEYTRHLLRSARDANQNSLRVWGGGFYETDVFYSLADEYGLLIWHDMMFACALYPVTDDFLETVTTEIAQQIQRLQYHPSVLIWAGNNENEGALMDNWWGVSDKEKYKADYVVLYIDVIMNEILKWDSSRQYVPSSPSNGNYTMENGYITNNPGNTRYGDIHYYNYGADGWNPYSYPRPRMATEYGFQSWCTFETLSRVSEEADWQYFSELLLHRQHHGNGNVEMLNSVTKHLNLPPGCTNNPNEDQSNCTGRQKLSDLMLLTQISQAMSIKTESEHYRRLRNEEDAFTMGALYWQLEDIWEAPTWASIEYGGKWKMLHYYSTHFFAPLIASPFFNDGVLNVVIVNDLPNAVEEGQLSIRIRKWADVATAYTETLLALNFPAASETKVFEGDLDTLLSSAGCGQGECFVELFAADRDGRIITPYNYYFLTHFGEAQGLRKPNLQVTSVVEIPSPTIEGAVQEFELTLTTDVVAPFVWLELGSLKGRFSDNGFILSTPELKVRFYSWQETSVDEIQSTLSVRSLMDMYD